MSEETIYLNIAGFVIKTVFKEDFLGSVYHKDQLVNDIRFLYNGYLPKKSDNWDHEVIIQDTEPFSIYQALKKKVYHISIYKRISQRKTLSWYHISSAQYTLLIRNILEELVIKNNGFVLHASSVLAGNYAYLFLGKSGAGKSTIASLLGHKYSLFSDDTVIIKPQKDTYYTYQFPVERKYRGEKSTRGYPIKCIFQLQQSPKCKLRSVTDTTEISSLLLEQLMLRPHETSQQIHAIMRLIEKISQIGEFKFNLKRDEVANEFAYWLEKEKN